MKTDHAFNLPFCQKLMIISDDDLQLLREKVAIEIHRRWCIRVPNPGSKECNTNLPRP